MIGTKLKIASVVSLKFCHHVTIVMALADLEGGGKGTMPPNPVKTSKKRWPPCAAASFRSHVAPLDKFVDPLVDGIKFDKFSYKWRHKNCTK